MAHASSDESAEEVKSREKPNQRKNLCNGNNIDSPDKSLDKPEEGAISSENGLKPSQNWLKNHQCEGSGKALTLLFS
ncbi:unnamed protein product [Arabis nemorensis]|uniref:Uncharacterized protein n=1 Tax=Arabis nemorensis TaxID=586526 RepID=A0A565C831_9BRAS|nr:unnamed protein product [Arabis nemorensis]